MLAQKVIPVCTCGKHLDTAECFVTADGCILLKGVCTGCDATISYAMTMTEVLALSKALKTYRPLKSEITKAEQDLANDMAWLKEMCIVYDKASSS
jgi:hypothetical protein